MTYAQLITLVVLTLLQLCRATPQSSKQPDEWFSASIGVNDGYSPQSISELFSTLTSPTTQPIVIVPSSTASPLEYDDISSVTVPIKLIPTEAPSSSTSSNSFSSTNPTQSSSFQPGTQFISSKRPQQLAPDGFSQQPPSIVFPDQTQPLLVRQPGILNMQNQTSFINQQNIPIQNIGVTNMPTLPQSTLRTTIGQSPQTTVTIQPRPQNTASLSTPASVPTKSVTVTNPAQVPFPVMKIRVRAPSGSVTNIRFVSSTTKRPTTKTTRTPKSRNTYNSCINICGGRRDPICATPLSKQINADNLKGFPSVCHMACHNSFKSDRYEKVVEGKCGKLRTHIRTLDSKKKLKKDELQKTQYTLVQNNNAVVEFESLVQ